MNDLKVNKVVLSLVSDLIFAVFIEDVTLKLGYQVRTLGSNDLPSQPGPLEGVTGPGEILKELRPALILIDLADAHIAWQEWIAAAKTHPATRKIPVVCFGPHVDTRLLAAARQAGADAVLARSRIKSGLPEIIQKYALQDVSNGA